MLGLDELGIAEFVIWYCLRYFTVTQIEEIQIGQNAPVTTIFGLQQKDKISMEIDSVFTQQQLVYCER